MTFFSWSRFYKKKKKVLEYPKFDEVLGIIGSGVTLTNNEYKILQK